MIFSCLAESCPWLSKFSFDKTNKPTKGIKNVHKPTAYKNTIASLLSEPEKANGLDHTMSNAESKGIIKG